MSRAILIALAALFYVCKMMGIAPIGLNRLGPETFARSISGILYNVALYFALLWLNVITCVRMLERQVYQEKILGLIYQTLIFFNTTIIISNFCLKQRQLIDILNRLVEIKNLTFELDRVDKSRWRSFFKDVAMVFGFIVFCLTISLVLQSFCTDEDIGENCAPLIVLGYTFNDFMILFIYVQYSLLLIVVLHAARLMNDNLSALPRHLTLRQGGSDSEFVAILAKIERCRELYSRFVDFVDDFSDFFSFPMLSIICFFLISYICSVFYCVRPLIITFENIASLVDYGVEFIVFFWHTWVLQTLTSSVSAVEQEILKTGVIVSDLLDVFYDATIHKKLNNFSVHILIKKAEIKVFDMFHLNQDLMLSMLQTISTYVFINIQFLLSSDRQ
ncbi:uncharacterized protein LOC106652136 [Trichogramma pretiosum]|uniref:uncharacterized protein LOC106652136 n=1 Tax=Trichogramma pretiosum TaxID=7493 RepID=UPI000C71B6D4|nr:uncharacterized protein LOC106652136 [Trichogramma pretiosum]